MSLFALALAVACGGGSEAPIPDVADAHAERDVTDGVAQLTTTVTVRFDRRFEFDQARVPLPSLFEFQVPEAGGGTTRVLVQEAAVSPDDARTVTLKVDRLIPDQSELRISKSAFRRDEKGQIVAKVRSDVTELAALLGSTQFAVTNTDLLDASNQPEPQPADRDAAAMRAALDAHLQARGTPQDVRDRALQRYDEMPPDIVLSPKLRAALAGLTGTFAEGAIDDLLTANNCTGMPAARIAFEVPPDAPDLFARVTFTPDGARIVSVNPILEGDRFERLMPILAHEAIHCDDDAGRIEEVAATAFDSFLYLGLITVDPTIVEGGTKLSKDLNVDVVAMFNSGRRFPESVGVLPSIGVKQVLPLSSVGYASFAELVAAAYEGIPSTASPEEPLAHQYAAVLAQANGMPEGPAFNLAYLDELLGRSVDPASLATVIQVFGLAPSE
ncbi:MAG: hypothetical protein ACM3S1_13870 [Hyphomicrobiales bacterium]